ncbi:hypothetical protein DSO57_1005765 [Entomophthora muscae]|uniref:Uncharacterized protein n=1 Tax=Entomophthora muscae TaxID=34485 RepID=A0ACC2U6Y6_9FUNG|nr:hypothetical protein DSO57_1005765 [Entomophthora muscae]
MDLWFTNLISYIFLILLHLKSSKHQHSSSEIGSQAPVDKPESFDYYCTPDASFDPVHFTKYPHNPDHKPWTLEDLQWKYNNPAPYLVPTEPPLAPKPTISTPPTSDATGHSSQFLGVLYLALSGLIDSALPAEGPWAVAGKALSYLVKLGPIIWWTMPVPAYDYPSPEGASQYSRYPDSEACHSHNIPSVGFCLPPELSEGVLILGTIKSSSGPLFLIWGAVPPWNGIPFCRFLGDWPKSVCYHLPSCKFTSKWVGA